MSNRATRSNPNSDRPKRRAKRRAGRTAIALAMLIAGSPIASQAEQWTAVPKPGSSIQAPVAKDATREGWNLQWRKSGQVTPPTPIARVSHQTRSQPVQNGNLSVAQSQPALRPVVQTAYMNQPQRTENLFAPPASLGQGAGAPSTDAPANDFFSNPFGDSSAAQGSPTSGNTTSGNTASGNTTSGNTVPATAPQSGGMLFPPDSQIAPPASQASPTLPNETRPMNDLRSLNQDMTLPETTPQSISPQNAAPEPSRLEDLFGAPESAPRPEPKPQADPGPSLGDMLRDSEPPAGATDDPLESPSDRSVQELPPPRDRQDFDNPFPRMGDDADKRDRDRLNERGRNSDGVGTFDDDFEQDLKQAPTLTCDEFRRRIEFQTIDKISLDISPPYRPDEIDQDRYEKLKADFDEDQLPRQWRNVTGVPLVSGRLVDLAYEKAVIETDFGTTESLPVNQLSEADLAYISQNWGLPKECLIEQTAYAPRQWTPMTMTYKASNLCHNPLYFEDVNLERYGHTHGPILEPFVQTAHFFGNVAVLPYKMGVHGPQECQYALGYYRPGSCAPWIKQPVPISARGALFQAAAVTGLFWMIP